MGARPMGSRALLAAGVLLLLQLNAGCLALGTAGSPLSATTPNRSPTSPMISLFPPLTYAGCASLSGVVEPTTSGASVTSVKLDWGDGSKAGGPLPAIHGYSRTGTYIVTASATDSLGSTSSVSVPIKITTNDTLSPPTLDVLPLAVEGDEVTVEGVVNYNGCGPDQGGAMVSWGDGTELDMPVQRMLPATHAYSANGIFNVCVDVNDTYSQQAHHCESVMVRNVVGGDGSTGPTNIDVTVMDKDFKVVPNATVQMANAPNDQNLLRCLTDSRGSCEFDDVRPGVYYFVAIAQGIGSRAEGTVNVTAHHTGHALALWGAQEVAGSGNSGLVPAEVGTIAAVVGAVVAAAGAVWGIARRARGALRRRAEPP